MPFFSQSVSRVVAFLILFCSSLDATNTNCSTIKKISAAAIKQTWATEWEFFDLPKQISERSISNIPALNAMNNSRLNELYSLQGKQKNSDRWVEGLIPEHIAKNEEMQKIIDAFPEYFKKTTEGVYVETAKVPRNLLFQFIFKVLEARSEKTEGLQLRKRPSVKTPLLPEALAEEWRTRRDKRYLTNLEFAFPGAAKSPEEVKQFIKQLFESLGWSKNGLSLEQLYAEAMGHTHHVYDPREATPEIRKIFYGSLKAEWGDVNDRAELGFIASLASDKTMDGKFINKYLLEEFVKTVASRMQNGAIGILSREMYEGVAINEDGIAVPGQRAGEKDFPTKFKLLRMGLRGFYSGPITEGRVPVVGLERRSLESNLFEDFLKQDKTPQQILDSPPLEGPRGLISSMETLKQKAAPLGLSPELFSMAEKNFEAIKIEKEDNDLVTTIFFLPLNNLIDHPLTRKYLSGLSPEARVRFIESEKQAMQQYVSEVNNLVAKLKEGKKYIHRYQNGFAGEQVSSPDNPTFFRTLIALMGEYLSSAKFSSVFITE